MEIDYFIKIKKRNVQNIAKTALFPHKKFKQKSQRKTSKHRSLKLRNRYEKHTTKLAVKSNASTSRKTMLSQPNIHRDQANQATDSRNPDHSKIINNSSRVSNFHFHIGTLILNLKRPNRSPSPLQDVELPKTSCNKLSKSAT